MDERFGEKCDEILPSPPSLSTCTPKYRTKQTNKKRLKCLASSHHICLVVVYTNTQCIHKRYSGSMQILLCILCAGAFTHWRCKCGECACGWNVYYYYFFYYIILLRAFSRFYKDRLRTPLAIPMELIAPMYEGDGRWNIIGKHTYHIKLDTIAINVVS